MTLSIYSDFGQLSVRVGVPEAWTGTAHVRVTRWVDDDSTEEATYQFAIDVACALNGVPPSIPGIPLDVWGAVVALLVREHARLATLQAVHRILGTSR